MTGWKRWVAAGGVLIVVLVVVLHGPGVRSRCSAATSSSSSSACSRSPLLAVLVLVEVRHQLVDADRRIDGLVARAGGRGARLRARLLHHGRSANPDQIAGLDTRLDSLYFTMTTLLTIGYGDIHAAGQAARALVLIQMVFNVVIIATAATTLTSRIRTRRSSVAEAACAPAEGGRSLPRRRRHGRRTHRNPT